MSRFLAFAAGNVTRWVILAAFLPLFAVAGMLGGQLEQVTENEQSSFLPGDAESSKALDKIEQFPGGESAAIITVYRRDGGLSARDRELIAEARQRVNGDPPPFLAPAGRAIVSKDGTTALLVAQVKATDGDSDAFLDAAEGYEKRTEIKADPGLEQKLTGPAGFSRDAIEVFGQIDGALLGAAALLVLVLLVIIYRSPVFWLWPFISVVFALVVARAAAYLFAELGLTVNGQSSGILSVLVFGAGTDYALLLVARYREELRKRESRLEAIQVATRRAGVPILASGATVIAALLCLTLAKVNGTAGLGPVGAIGIAAAMFSALVMLPALLATVGGRWSFWPRVPHFGDAGTDETHGAFRKVGERVARHPRRTWIATTALLVLLACGLFTFNTNLTNGNSFRDDVESVAGQELIDQGFPAGTNAPTDVVVAKASDVPAVTARIREASYVESVRPIAEGPPGVRLQVTLKEDPYSVGVFDRIPDLRERAQQNGVDAVVGGPTAQEYDLREAATDDTLLIVPIALFVVFLILVLLLRSLLAPVLLMATVVLSFAAALGIGSFFATEIFGFPGLDATFPLFVFVFLVALGIDYNIFLMARVREESLKHGTRPGMLRGLAVTGAVITSAGIVLAGTFGVLAVLPLIFLTTLGFTIAVGVLLDTFIVRSVLVPALTFDIGAKIWWPSALAKKPDEPDPPPEAEPPADPAPVAAAD